MKECEGLPVAIVTTVKALKGDSMGVHRNVLDKQRRSTSTDIR